MKRCGIGILFFLCWNIAAQAQSAGQKQSVQLVQPDTSKAVILLTTPQRPLPAKISLVAPDQHTRCFGFFCRQELKLDRKMPIPLRVRAGSLEQCNFLEGKK